MDKRRVIVSVIVLLLLTLGAWALGLFGGTDPAIAELEQLREKMSDRTLSDDQRQQLRDDFRARLDSLSNDERRAFFQNGRQFWMQRAEQRMDEFFAMAAPDQQRQLDEMLNRMAARGNQPAGANRPQRRSAGPRGEGGGGRNMTDAQRDERAKRRLDHSSPKMRAQFAEFRRRLNERAQQRGIDQGNLPGRYPRGGRWRGTSEKRFQNRIRHLARPADLEPLSPSDQLPTLASLRTRAASRAPSITICSFSRAVTFWSSSTELSIYTSRNRCGA
jgi:hypothetical protein